MNYKAIFSLLAESLTTIDNDGDVASYIPELSKVDGNKFAMHMITLDDQHHSLGDEQESFSIQSIAKVLSLTLAFELTNEDLWQRVGVEPSGTAFNSLVQLEYEHGIPRNPFINAGAIVICDVLLSVLDNPKDDFIHFVRQLVDNQDINYNQTIAESEKATSYQNAALINLMKSYGNIHNDIDQVLDFYFNLCSIKMSCKELAQCFMYLATNGVNPLNNKRITSVSKAKRINAIMQLCGFYDEAGEFSFKVGLPGKSGVGGGIIAVHPGQYSVAVWSPKLNAKGNSYRGIKVLELLTTQAQSSIF